MDEILESIYGKIHPVFDEKMNILVGNIHFLKHNEYTPYTPSRPRLTDRKKKRWRMSNTLDFHKYFTRTTPTLNQNIAMYRVLPLNKLSNRETNFAI